MQTGDMEYDEFEVEYKRVFEVILKGRGDRDLTADIARLHALAAQIDDEDDREDALLQVTGIEDVLAHGPAEPPSEIIMQAREVYAEAVRDDGTDAERLARAEEGIQALMRIENATAEEEGAIGSMEHTLRMLADALRPDTPMKVTTFRDLMREQANAAVQVSGAHHSSWNGALRGTDPRRGLLPISRLRPAPGCPGRRWRRPVG
jgi:hypothetical protein